MKKSKMERQAKKAAKKRAAILAANPAMIPLLELFSVVDDVFTTEGAFEPEYIQKSLGRCYRQWKDTRSALDPEFDPKRYPKKQRRRSTKPKPSGRKIEFSSTVRK